MWFIYLSVFPYLTVLNTDNTGEIYPRKTYYEY